MGLEWPEDRDYIWEQYIKLPGPIVERFVGRFPRLFRLRYPTSSLTMVLTHLTFIGTLLLSTVSASRPWHYPEVPRSCGYPGGGPTATIDAGVVIGTTTSLPAATATVNQFLGVPFAKSPPTRFAPPESPGTFSEPILAQSWSPACIQQFTYPRSAYEFTRAVFNQPTPEESEDCL